MNLRNYTSSAPVERSTAGIERLLVDAGATHIARSYADNALVGFIFTIEVSGKPITFKLPANPAAVKRLMEKGIKRARPGTARRLQEQAARTAWKLLHDWVHVQLSLIQMGQADAVQIFLPYAYDALKNETIYDRLKANGFKALTAGETHD
ncbi:MAG: hypothetical protein HY890_01575 [Deltaproteobacteria bacterium]|nr:hypothetical protein [Deltaproteobacteria bacterium]